MKLPRKPIPPLRRRRLLRAQMLRGRRWGARLHIQPITSTHAKEPQLKSLLNHCVARLNKKILTPHQIRTAQVNLRMPWIRVYSVEQLAQLNGKNNYLSICLRRMQEIEPLLKADVLSVREEYELAKKVISLFRDPDIIYFSPFVRKKVHGVVFFTGPKATDRQMMERLEERLVMTDNEYFEKISKAHEESVRRTQGRRGPISHYELNPHTQTFIPIYRN